MKKELDFNKTVAELVEEFPEFQQAMAEIGFKEITNPMVLNVMGRVMTVPKGVAIKGMKLEDVVRELEARGFTIKQDEAAAAHACSSCGTHEAQPHVHGEGGCGCTHAAAATGAADGEATERAAVLKGFLQRLSAGESLETVRKDFIKDFASVSAEEISAAEQQLIEGGTPIHEVQKLCDVHSALFHGHIGGAAPAADAAPEVQDLPDGHPLTVLNLENKGLSELLDRLKTALEANDVPGLSRGLGELHAIYSHYGKKESLLMTLLYRYGVTGPSGVMWGVDDEIKAELRALMKSFGDELKSEGAVEEVTIRNWAGVDVLTSLLLDHEADVAAVPSYVGADPCTKGDDLRLAAITVWGMLYVLGPKEDEGADDMGLLTGRRIGVPPPNDMPDLVFRYLLAQKGIDAAGIDIVPYPDAQELLNAFVSGQLDWAVCPSAPPLSPSPSPPRPAARWGASSTCRGSGPRSPARTPASRWRASPCRPPSPATRACSAASWATWNRP